MIEVNIILPTKCLQVIQLVLIKVCFITYPETNNITCTKSIFFTKRTV